MKKTRIMNWLISLMLVVLLIPGCSSQEKIGELEERITGLEERLTGLESQIGDLSDQLTELINEMNDQPVPDPAIVKIINPETVLLKEGKWSWEMSLREVSGIGVKLEKITVQIYGENGLVQEWNDESWLQSLDYYLPAYGLVKSGRQVSYNRSLTHTIFIVSGTDENGYSIVVDSKIDFSYPAEGEGKIEIAINPNPVTCQGGLWKWRMIFNEVNGVGIKIKEVSTTYFLHDTILTKNVDTSEERLAIWFPPDGYLQAYGLRDAGGGLNCQSVTSWLLTVIGIDDNGNEITATAEINFLK